MPGLKNSKPGVLLDIPVINARVFSQTDSAYDFFNKHTLLHGYLYKNMAADVSLADAKPLYLGPINELTLQAIGTVTLAVQGSLDGTTWVNANVVASADGLVRIQSKYRWFKIAGTSVSGAPSVYLMTS